MSDTQSVKYDSQTSLEQCLSHLDRLADAMRRGEVHVSYGESAVRLRPGSRVHFELKAKQKGDKESLSMEFSWLGLAMGEGSGVTIAAPERPSKAASDSTRASSQARSAKTDSDESRSAEYDGGPSAKTASSQARSAKNDSDESEKTDSSQARSANTVTAASVRKEAAHVTRGQLYVGAQAISLEGRSQMSKDELVRALNEQGISPLKALPREELYELAQQEEISGRSEMSKEGLIEALRASWS